MEQPIGLLLESRIIIDMNSERRYDSERSECDEYLDLVNIRFNLFDNIQFATIISDFLIDKKTPKEYYYFKSINKQCREISKKYNDVYCISNYFSNNRSYNYSHKFFENLIKYVLNNRKDSKVIFSIEILSKTNPIYFSKLIFESILSGAIYDFYENINHIFLKYDKKSLISENILKYMGSYCEKKMILPTLKKLKTERENFFFVVLYHIYIHKHMHSENYGSNIRYELLYDYLDSINIDMYLMIQDCLQQSNLFGSINDNIIINSNHYFFQPERMIDENMVEYYRLVYLILNIYLFKYKFRGNYFEINKDKNIDKKNLVLMINILLRHIPRNFEYFYEEFDKFGVVDVQLEEYIFDCIYHQLNINLPLDIKTISKKFFGGSYDYELGYPINIFSNILS
jgi:hypothetical protein